MGVTPQGISIQTAYRWFREGVLIVNRQYQRKLIWTVAEKQRLVDSVLLGYPLPLFLLAEKFEDGHKTYEIIDGMQRLNAVFGFIENDFLLNEKCFSVIEFATARQLAEKGVFKEFGPEVARLDARSCANIQDYQLAVTIFPGEDEDRITDIFGRINSGGKQLSDQERRQAGVLSPFANLVRQLAAEIRGDVSRDKLKLSEMPEISIETSKDVHGYTLNAKDIFWCFQGILRTDQLRNSEDEQMLADVVGSILFEQPVRATGEFLDKLYLKGNQEESDLNRKISAYPALALADQVKKVFSVLKESIEASNPQRFHFRSVVYPTPTSNAQKQAFYAVFMAFFDLVVREQKLPSSPEKIWEVLNNLSTHISVGQKHTKTADRLKNIKVVKGLIADCFAKSDVLTLGHGPGLVLDFENSLRRSKMETSRYEFKQGVLRLDHKRDLDPRIFSTLLETICGIANLGPDADGFIYIGIADKTQDALRISKIDNLNPINFEHVNIVGVEREANLLGQSMDQYLRKFEDSIVHSDLSEPLKTQVRTSIDSIVYKGLSVIRIRVPKQSSVSFLGDACYMRSGSSTSLATGRQIASLTNLF